MIKNKKGQMVIWAIVALTIVVAIILLMFLRTKTNVNVSNQQGPTKFIETCTRDAVLKTVEKMMSQGGFVNPSNYKIYKDTKVEYQCLNVGNYEPCINQHPAFLNEEKEEIIKNTQGEIEDCFAQLKNEGQNRNENVRLGTMNYSVTFAPGRILVNLQMETEISKNGETTKFNQYSYEIESPLYDLANVAVEIVTQQAKYCYFEYNGYMILYPKYKIDVFTMSDSTRIYTIDDKNSGNKLNIAVRSCAIPPGI